MAKMKAGKVFVGVGGWNFAPWRDNFYPKGLTQARELHYASRQLSSIEINSTFYGLQKPATFQKWHDETPDGFVFSVKAPRFVTNRNDLATSVSSIERFLGSGVLQLGAKLGPINWQLAPAKALRREGGRRIPRAAAAQGGRPRRCARARSAAREFRLRGVDQACARSRGRCRRSRRFCLSTHPGTQRSIQLLARHGYEGQRAERLRARRPRALAEHAQTLARDGDVFLYFISGAKERNPHAAMALMGSDPIS